MDQRKPNDRTRHLLISNTTWVLSAEAMARASRVVTLLALSYYLESLEYGTVILALTCHEMLRVFTRLGCGAKVIQCDQDQVAAFGRNAITLQWVLCICLCVFQFLLTDLIAYFYDNPALSELLKIMAFAHLFYPIVSIKVFLLQRANRLRYVGIASGLCMALENLSIALLLWFNFGIYAAAIAKIIAAFIWVCLFSLPKVQLIKAGIDTQVMLNLIRYSSKILLTELTKSFRHNFDLLLAGRLLDGETFGIYSFAKSAGLGLAQSLGAAFNSALYPYLCLLERSGQSGEGLKSTWIMYAGICALFLLQAILAPFYIELLFNERWAEHATLVSILCLAAIPLLGLDTLCTSLRAKDKPLAELKLVASSTVFTVVAITLIQAQSAQAFALAFTQVAYTCALVFSGYLYFKPSPHPHNTLAIARRTQL
jgi:PST family polysaccharide transporter